MKNAWKEFKAFAMGGNMLDLALGFIIGAAFAALVESLASNILMQLVAAIFGMNTSSMPIVDSPHGFWIIIGLMLTGTLSMLAFFRWKKWL